MGGNPVGIVKTYTRRGIMLSAVFTLGILGIIGSGGGGGGGGGGNGTTTYSVGGSVSGLNGSVVLQNNGGDNLTINADGTFTFATKLADGAAYNVTVLTQPSGQTCTVTNGSGTISGADVGNVSVSCVNNYTIGGTLSGLLSGSITLQNNGGDDLTLNTSGAFTFATPIPDGSTYNVTISAPPPGYNCILSGGFGTVSGANVTSVSINCTINTYPIGGNISGLNGSVTLQNNGSDDLTLDTNGEFAFATEIEHGQGYAVTVSAQPAGQSCTVVNGSGTVNAAPVTNIIATCTDIAQPDDVAGSWRGEQTFTTATPQNSGSCDHSVNESIIEYSSITQTNQNLTLINAYGVEVTGTIGATVPADISLAGSGSYTDPLSAAVYNVSINMTGTLGATGSITGIMAMQYSIDSVNTCYEEADISANRIYQYSGSENYDGVYALELDSDNGRDIAVVEIDVTGAALALYDVNGAKTLTSSSFDSATGAYSATIQTIENDIANTESTVTTELLTGLFVRADTDVSGLPIVVAKRMGYWEHFDGLNGAGVRIDQGYLSDYEGYGKPYTADVYTRSSYYRKSGGGYVEGIYVGFLQPPLKTANALYVEVLDGPNQLCWANYSGRYYELRYPLTVNMAQEEFQEDPYSFVSCNTSDENGNHTVTNGASYTIRIMDIGPDDSRGTADDFEVISSTMVADVHPSFFADRLAPNDFVFNNDQPPATMTRGNADGLIELFGFVDTNDDISLSWPTLAGAEEYQLQISSEGSSYRQLRYNTTNSNITLSVNAQEHPLDADNASILRVVGLKTESSNDAVAQSLSMSLRITPGVTGVFNVELDQVVPGQGVYNTFQVALTADMVGNVSQCEVTNSLGWRCNVGGTTVDYSNNRVNLSLTDLVGHLSFGTYTVVLNFNDSATGTVSSSDIAAINNGPTAVRLVNPELKIRTIRRSSGSNQNQTQVNIYNAMYAGQSGVFNQATFSNNDDSNLFVGGVDTGSNLEYIWDNAVTDEEWWSVMQTYMQMPIDDGETQDYGTFVTKRTQQHWSLGGGRLASGLYKSIWNTSDPSVKWVFKYNYTRPDASSLVAPQLTDVTVIINGTGVTAGVGNGDAGNPISFNDDVSFDLTWDGSTVSNGEWQIVFTEQTAGFEIRTEWMTAAHPDLTDNGGGTSWTWTNPYQLAEPGDDITWRIQIRTRDADDTMAGIQIGSDMVYVNYNK